MEERAVPLDADNIESVDSDDFRSQIIPLLILTSIFFLNFIARVSLAPLMPEIERELGLSHGEAGFIFLLISLGYFITLFGSGWISSRFTHRRTVTFSSMTLGLAIIGTAFSSNLWAVRVGVLLLGMAAGLYLPSGIATLTAVVSSRHWGKAIAIHELAPNLSFVVAPLLSEIVLIWFSWRAVLVLLGVAAMLNAMSFARFGRGGDFKGVTPSLSSFRPFLVEPAFWIMLLLFSLGISGSLAVYTMLPLYLITEHGLDRNLTNTLVAVSRISGIVMAFAGGWVTDRFGPKKTLVSVFLLTGVTTVLLGAVSSSWVLVIVFLQPMLAVCFFPAGFASLSRIGPSNSRNLAVSLTIPFAFLIGGGAIPAGIGFMGDTVSFALGIVMVGGLILCGAGLACFLRFQEKRAPSP